MGFKTNNTKHILIQPVHERFKNLKYYHCVLGLVLVCKQNSRVYAVWALM